MGTGALKLRYRINHLQKQIRTSRRYAQLKPFLRFLEILFVVAFFAALLLLTGFVVYAGWLGGLT